MTRPSRIFVICGNLWLCGNLEEVIEKVVLLPLFSPSRLPYLSGHRICREESCLPSVGAYSCSASNTWKEAVSMQGAGLWVRTLLQQEMSSGSCGWSTVSMQSHLTGAICPTGLLPIFRFDKRTDSKRSVVQDVETKISQGGLWWVCGPMLHLYQLEDFKMRKGPHCTRNKNLRRCARPFVRLFWSQHTQPRGEDEFRNF